MRPYTSNRTCVSLLLLRTLAHSLNQTSFGASEMIRNMCFILVFWPVLNLERLFLYHFHVETRPAGNLLGSLKVDHLVELQIYQATCARACLHGAVRHESVGKSNWTTLLIWYKSNHWKSSSDKLFLRQALRNGTGYAWSVKGMCIPPYNCLPLQPLCGAISALQCSAMLWWGNWSKLVSEL